MENRESLGFIQVEGENINYVNIVRCYSAPFGEGPDTLQYRLDYIVLLGGIPPSLSLKTKLKKSTRYHLWGPVVDVEWQGGSLGDRLNDDLLLKQSLLTQYQENRRLKIEIVLESAGQHL